MKKKEKLIVSSQPHIRAKTQYMDFGIFQINTIFISFVVNLLKKEGLVFPLLNQWFFNLFTVYSEYAH